MVESILEIIELAGLRAFEGDAAGTLAPKWSLKT
jgi:hypothetical protein